MANISLLRKMMTISGTAVVSFLAISCAQPEGSSLKIKFPCNETIQKYLDTHSDPIRMSESQTKLWMLELGYDLNDTYPEAISWNDGEFMPCRKLRSSDSYPSGATEICQKKGSINSPKYLDDMDILTINDDPPRRYRAVFRKLTSKQRLTTHRDETKKCIHYDPSNGFILALEHTFRYAKVHKTPNTVTYRMSNFEGYKLLTDDDF